MMNELYSEEFKRIIEASHTNTLTFFVGAGVSALSGAPNWTQLINQICSKLSLGKPQKKYSWEECLRIPQIYYCDLKNKDKKHADQRYYNFLNEQLNTDDFKTNQIHKEIFKLKPASIITTNFDNLLEMASIESCKTYKSIAMDEEVPEIGGDSFILKIHGDLKRKNIVLKEEDYLNYSTDFKLIDALVKSIFSTNTVVFIGYSLSDYNINLIINWVKVLLGSKFKHPIFVYTGDENLDDRKNQYYNDIRKLSVIDCNRLTEITDEKDYLTRYNAFFSLLNKWSRFHYSRITNSMIDTEDISSFELFDILFERLSPLDKLHALKISDITKQLNAEIIIDERGCIIRPPNHLVHPFFERFVEVHDAVTSNTQHAIDNNTLHKYYKIKSVLKKAWIFEINVGDRYVKVVPIKQASINQDCIRYNYNAILKFVRSNHLSIISRYKKAYYLTRLFRYSEALEEFKLVAIDSFNNKNYLLYYLSKINTIFLSKFLSHITFTNDDELNIPDDELSALFSSLPYSFRCKYSFLKELHEPVELYRYFYYAMVGADRLRKTADNNATVLGIHPYEKVNSLIMERIRFILDNCLVMDVFSEFNTSISYLMKSVLYSCSMQSKKEFGFSLKLFSSPLEYIFDESDFYCIVENFKPKELLSILLEYKISELKFSSVDVVYKQVYNIFDYFTKISLENNVIRLMLYNKIRTILVLLCFIKLSKSATNMICRFIFKDEFDFLGFTDISYFLNKYLSNTDMHTKIANQLIFDKLLRFHSIRYSSFQIDPTPSQDYLAYKDYRLLANYIRPSHLHSKLVFECVLDVINNHIKDMYPDVTIYWILLTKQQQCLLHNWVVKYLSENFDLSFFKVLIKSKYKYLTDLIQIFNTHFQQLVALNEHSSWLPIIGFLCFRKMLDKQDYASFVGQNAHFDFFCDNEHFDYSRFDLEWLFLYNNSTLKCISHNVRMREMIRPLIAKSLRDGVKKIDHDRLYQILINYFC